MNKRKITKSGKKKIQKLSNLGKKLESRVYETSEKIIILNSDIGTEYKYDKETEEIEAISKKSKNVIYYPIKEERNTKIGNTRLAKYYCTEHFLNNKPAIKLIGQMSAVGHHFAEEHPEKITHIKKIISKLEFLLARCEIFVNRLSELDSQYDVNFEGNLREVMYNLIFNKKTIHILYDYLNEKYKDQQINGYSNASVKLIKNFLDITENYLLRLKSFIYQSNYFCPIDEDSKKLLIDIKLENYVDLDLFSKSEKQAFMFLAPLDSDNDKELTKNVLLKEKKILDSLKIEKNLKEKKNYLEQLFFKNDIETNLVKEFADIHESGNEENKIFIEFQTYLYHKYVIEQYEILKTEKRINRIKNLKKKDILPKKEIVIPEEKEQHPVNKNIIDLKENKKNEDIKTNDIIHILEEGKINDTEKNKLKSPNKEKKDVRETEYLNKKRNRKNSKSNVNQEYKNDITENSISVNNENLNKGKKQTEYSPVLDKNKDAIALENINNIENSNIIPKEDNDKNTVVILDNEVNDENDFINTQSKSKSQSNNKVKIIEEEKVTRNLSNIYKSSSRKSKSRGRKKRGSNSKQKLLDNYIKSKSEKTPVKLGFQEMMDKLVLSVYNNKYKDSEENNKDDDNNSGMKLRNDKILKK